MDQTSITLPGAIDTFGVVDRYRIQLALVPFVEITAPLDAAPTRRVQRKMLVTAAPVARVLIVLVDLLRVLLHLTVGSPSIAGGVILLFQAVWMVLATR